MKNMLSNVKMGNKGQSNDRHKKEVIFCIINYKVSNVYSIMSSIYFIELIFIIKKKDLLLKQQGQYTLGCPEIPKYSKVVSF